MKILVTGASGFVGLNMLKRLAREHPGAEIVAADLHEPIIQDQARVASDPGRIEFRSLDVTDAAACVRLMAMLKPTHVLHAAAVTLPDESSRSKELTYAVNLEGTRNVLEAAVSAGSIERCVLLSSSGVYKQSFDAMPCDEEHPLDLSMSYAHAKREAEMLMVYYERIGGFAVVAARVGPVYGEFERSSSTRPNVSMIQRILDLLAGQDVVCVAGTDTHRDWTYADDIAAGLDALLVARELNHRIYNVSSGVSISARSILDWFVEHGLRMRWTGDKNKADVVLDPQDNRKPLVIERLQNDTGFTPQFEMKRTIARIIETHKQSSQVFGKEGTFAHE